MINEINETLQHILDHIKDGPVKEAATYSLMAGGKRIRPTLMLMVLKSYGLDYHPYLDVACAIEMIHTYSLIHDDLPAMDNDDLRRGKPTCHKQFDEATAILAGDALLTEAFYIVLNNNVLTDSQKVQITKILNDAAGQNGMIYGQQQDMYFETRTATLEQLQDIHHYKTGCLFTAPLMMASCIARPEDMEKWQELGFEMGLAFQVQDDILDVIGDEELLGKPVGSDVANNKSTYVSLLGLEKAKEKMKEHYKNTIASVYSLQINHGLIIGIIEGMTNRNV